VVLVSGGFPPRGGSVKKPVLGEARADTLLEVRDVPLAVGLQDRGLGAGDRTPADPHTAAAVLAQETRQIARFCLDLVDATRPIESVPRRTG